MNTKLIARSAVMTALLIVLQAATKSLGQFVTGSCVNFVLASTVLLCGIGGAIFTAVLSPFFAFLLGIGPAFLPVVPAICLGNLSLVFVLYIITGRIIQEAGFIRKTGGVVAAAAVKSALLYILTVKMIIPFLALPEKQAAVLSASFSWPQLVTALIGSSIAVFVAPRIAKAINK